MFNKIYVSIKNFIKDNMKEVIIFLVLLFIVTFPLPYYNN